MPHLQSRLGRYSFEAAGGRVGGAYGAQVFAGAANRTRGTRTRAPLGALVRWWSLGRLVRLERVARDRVQRRAGTLRRLGVSGRRDHRVLLVGGQRPTRIRLRPGRGRQRLRRRNERRVVRREEVDRLLLAERAPLVPALPDQQLDVAPGRLRRE